MKMINLSRTFAITVKTAAAAGVACLALSLAGPASADDGSTALRNTPVAQQNPSLSIEVLRSLPQAVLDSDAHIDSSYRPGMPIVRPDGTPVPGQSPEIMRKAATCRGTAYGPPGGRWGPITESVNCSIWGYPGYRQFYRWGKVPNVSTRGCAQVRGFPIVNGTMRVRQLPAGCGQSGSVKVPWGNTVGVPAARTASLGGIAGFTMSFTA